MEQASDTPFLAPGRRLQAPRRRNRLQAHPEALEAPRRRLRRLEDQGGWGVAALCYQPCTKYFAPPPGVILVVFPIIKAHKPSRLPILPSPPPIHQYIYIYIYIYIIYIGKMGTDRQTGLFGRLVYNRRPGRRARHVQANVIIVPINRPS